MLTILGAGLLCTTVIFLGFFFWSLIHLSVDGWKDVVIFASLAAICLGIVFFVESLTYNENVVNEYEIVSISSSNFSYKTDDGGISDKYLRTSEFIVYKSEDDRAYALETITTVRSKINGALHWFITLSSELGDQEVTYKIYLPEKVYQKYISK